MCAVPSPSSQSLTSDAKHAPSAPAAPDLITSDHPIGLAPAPRLARSLALFTQNMNPFKCGLLRELIIQTIDGDGT